MRLFFAIFFIVTATSLAQQGNSVIIEGRNRAVADTLRRAVAADTLRRAGADTTAADSLSAKKKIQRDTLKPVNQRALNANSFYVKLGDIEKSSYKTAHDLTGAYPLGFVKDFGFAVHPNELYINGSGTGSTSYLIDGVEAGGGSAWYNPLFIQTENIDSIEIITSPRSFLYGINNNSAGVNIITKNRISRIPLTRLMYNQAQLREGTLDAQYSSVVFKKFVLSFDITTKKIDDVVRNWSSSVWLGNAKLKYFCADKLDLVLSYDYRRFKINLTGGIDATALDSMPKEKNKTTKDYVYDVTDNSLLYDNLSYNKESFHGLSLKALSTYIENGYTDLTFFYRASLDEFRQNEMNDTSVAAKIPKSVLNVRDKELGSVFRQTYRLGFFDIDANAGFTAEKYDTNGTTLSNWLTSYSFSGKISAGLFEGAGIVSVFGKTARKYGFTFTGAGADLSVDINNRIRAYFGLSAFGAIKRKIDSSYFKFTGYVPGYFASAEKITANIVEGGLEYRDARLALNAKIVYRREDSKNDLFGAGVSLAVKYWKLVFENNSSYNDKQAAINTNFTNYSGPAYFMGEDILPKFQIVTGVYYKDILFETNLDLKAGINTRFTNYRQYPGVNYFGLFTQNTFVVNFEVQGEIQKTAILYFSWENLLNTKYMIVPFYPMPQRNIRFGVAWKFLN
jgi:hypothetical protein